MENIPGLYMVANPLTMETELEEQNKCSDLHEFELEVDERD